MLGDVGRKSRRAFETLQQRSLEEERGKSGALLQVILPSPRMTFKFAKVKHNKASPATLELPPPPPPPFSLPRPLFSFCLYFCCLAKIKQQPAIRSRKNHFPFLSPFKSLLA